MPHIIKADEVDYKKIAEILKKGGMIIYPTDTAYALGADGANERGIEKIFQIKNRDKSKSLPLIVADLAMARQYASFPGKALELANRYWPGPLTLVLPAKSDSLSQSVMQDGSVAMRVPNNKIAQAISRNLGRPIVSTSANISGQGNFYDIAGVKNSLGDFIEKIDIIIDAGKLPLVELSTIMKIEEDGLLHVLRQGGIKVSSNNISIADSH